MFTRQYDKLCQKYKPPHYRVYHKDKIDDGGNCRLLVTKGREHKGRQGVLYGFYRSDEIGILLDGDEEPFWTHYRNVGVFGEDGEIIPDASHDILGQEIEAGNWVVFSAKLGRTGHTAALGRVKKLNPSGSLKVSAEIYDGEKTESKWFSEFTVPVSKCLRIPVDETLLMANIISDFRNIGDI